MSQPDLKANNLYLNYGTNNHQGFYPAETINTSFSIENWGTEVVENFDLDIYLSTDETIDTSDFYLDTYTFTDGIAGRYVSSNGSLSSFPARANGSTEITLPDADSIFWLEQEEYYVGGIIDPDNNISESNENNNNIESDYRSDFNLLTTDLPVVNFRKSDRDTLKIELTEAAPVEGLAIDYHLVTKADYINDRDGDYSDSSYTIAKYDSELDRLYLVGESYYDLEDYKYYDTAEGYYDPVDNLYYNADGSYYDVAAKLFYDTDGNSTELVNNNPDYYPPEDDYEDPYNQPRHYLPTGGYISFSNDFFYDARGGYIDDASYGDGKAYFQYEDVEGYSYGTSLDEIRGIYGGAGAIDFSTLPRVATPDIDYELSAKLNIAEITDTTITIAPGETTATIDLSFLPDLVYDPNETVQFEVLENDSYTIGHSRLAPDQVDYNYDYHRVGIEELENPKTGNLNFDLPKDANVDTVVGQVNFSDPQGDELTYSLVTGHASHDDYYGYSYSTYDNNHDEIDLDPTIVETSNQDLDRDGIHPFTIDPETGTITLTDYDDLDREPSYVPWEDDPNDPYYEDDYEALPQLYHEGYYQLFVKVTDGTIDPDYDLASTYDYDNQLYEAELVNIKVVVDESDFSVTPNDDLVKGSINGDLIDALAGNDTVKGLAGDDTLIGNDGEDLLFGSSGNDSLEGNADNDLLNAGSGDDDLQGNLGNDKLLGGNGYDTLLGDEGNDTLQGGNGHDYLSGGDGSDTLVGMKGNDTLEGGLASDTLNGSEGHDDLKGMEGDDLLRGDIGMDILYGNDGNDKLVGMDDADTLYGGLGDDTISGGMGMDYLYGNEGMDIFAIEVDSGQDLIADFEDGIDLLDLPNGLSFEQVNIVDLSLYSATILQNSNDNQVLAVLAGIEADLITEADFMS